MKTILTILWVLCPLTSLLRADRPNILFCIADDASASSFGAYGSDWVKTPAIDRLANEGARFENAFCNNPKCAPARAALVTGRYSWQLGEAANHWPIFPKEFKFYPHLLRDAGYHVGFTGKGWGPGSYYTEDNPAGPEYNEVKLTPPFKGISKFDYAGNFSAFLEANNEGKPFCFWLGVKEPHRNYEEGGWKRVGRKLEEVTVPGFLPDQDIIRGDLLDYANEVEWYDTQVGRAVQILEEKGLLENTLVVITSDHGMPFPRGKGQVYEEGCRVPFIVYWKGVVQPGRVIEDFINFPDVAPTFMEVAGQAIHEQMTGKSFLDVLLASGSGQIDPSRDHVLLGKERHDTGRANQEGTDLAYPVRAIRTRDFFYSHNIKPDRWPVGNPEYGFRNTGDSPSKTYVMTQKPGDADYRFYESSFGMRPEEELFALSSDPHCLHNLADRPEYAEIKAQLRRQLDAELTAQGDPRLLGTGDIFDRFPFRGSPFNYETGKKAETFTTPKGSLTE